MPGGIFSARLQFGELYFLKKCFSALLRAALGLRIGPDKFTEEYLSISDTFSPYCTGMSVQKVSRKRLSLSLIVSP
jgi:hypothetical protein